MFLLEWTASDLLLIAVAAAAMIGTVIWLVPSVPVKQSRTYTDDEVKAYDRRIPLYFLAAAFSLVLGSVHMVIKNMPGFWQWLWEAGYGGHLFRDLANSHIIIVGGGTILLTGITWYILPRILNRPLYSNSLAAGSFWFTFIGVFGFYLAWLILGLVEGNLVRGGMEYLDAKAQIGSWHTVPTRITSSIMGVGYWTYVLNVFLTVWAAKKDSPKPLGYLTKFVVVSAGALFVGTVQGVLQVLPANADWIHNAGKFGQYVDPISHAHVNLVTGMLVSLVAFLGYFSSRIGGRTIPKRIMNILFWLLVPASLLFYLTFLFTGLIVGNGLDVPTEIFVFFASNFPMLIAIAGVIMLFSFWVYFGVAGWSLHFRQLQNQFLKATPAGFWLVSLIALFFGALQGLLQAIPSINRVLITPEEIPNIHAQLNMIGGMLLAMLGLVYYLLPELTEQTADSRLRRMSLFGITFGIAGYYVLTLMSGLQRMGYMSQGMTSTQAAQQIDWYIPFGLMIITLPILVGFSSFGLAVYRTTEAFRSEFKADFLRISKRFSGPMPDKLNRIPPIYMIGMEIVSGFFGWPGLGWLFAGKTMIAIFLMMVGPAITWAVLPMLFSPFTNTVFSQWNWLTLVVWLPASTLLSTLSLAFVLWRRNHAAQVQASAPDTNAQGNNSAAKPQQRRIPRRVAVGVALIVLFLFSVPILPFFMGISDGTPLYTLMPNLAERSTGAYLQVDDGQQDGLMKLYQWNFPLDEAPADSPVLNADFIQDIVISQRGLDTSDRYQLFHLHDGNNHQMSMTGTVDESGRQLAFTINEPLDEGDYMLSIPVDGMFAGREFYYFKVSPSITALPVVASASVDTTPTTEPITETSSSPMWLEIFPLAAATISALIVIIMVQRLRQKMRAYEAVWAIAFGMFAIAAGTQLFGDLVGWTPMLARLYYILGATLVVGWLGLGTWLILVHKPWLRNVGIWFVILLTGIGIGLILQTPVNETLLVSDGWHALEKPAALTVITIITNTVGTVILVGGALWSAWIFWRQRIMPQRMYGLILLAVGAMVVAGGGSLTRLGHQQYLYIAMSIGIGLMFWGYLKTIQPRQAPNPAADARPIPEVNLATESV
ncbi:MAG: cbb3-type cytochrome c oxidase subunit I [Anaerolineaceae bacterium]|nr:cbb3-type cytochrome c oxidase subunit I [Anaerolineaceae bacterium]